VPAGGREYAPHHVEAVPAAGERGARLVPVLARQPPHAARRHVRRIADDKVVIFSAKRGKQIGRDKTDPIAQPVALPIYFRHGQCGCRDIGGVYSRAGKAMREENGETARSGAEIERGLDRPTVEDPGSEVFAQ